MTELWVERTGVRRYTGRSTRGAQVLVGNEDVEGVFTPGELMKIALAACSGMASDAPLQHRLVARVLTVVERAIDQVCTVGRTLKSGTKVTLGVSGAGVS